jgi:hypothetical protein
MYSILYNEHMSLAVSPGLIAHASGPATADGAIAASTVTGGSGTYTSYAWTSGIGASTISTPTTLAAKSALLPGQYTLTVTDSASATASYVYDVSYVSPISTIVNASDPVASDYFGISSAVDGQYMVVGAYNKTQTQTGAGAAYVYKRTDTSATGTYTFETKLVSATPGASFKFGSSVAISGDTVVVGEPFGGTSYSGNVYVWFRTSGTTWTQQGPIVPSNPSANDNFGWSVAIDGDYIAVSAYRWDQKTPSAITDCGAAYVYYRTGTIWAQQAQLLAGDPSASDKLGYSIAISGATVVVGALFWDQKTPSAITDCGAAYVFVRTGTTWSQQAQLLASDPSATDDFGKSVSVSGDYVAVGAYTWDCKAPVVADCGCVYIYYRSGTTWTQQAQLTAGNQAGGDNLGWSVSINGSYLVTGAYGRTSYTGCAYLYKRTGTSWFLAKQLTASDAATTDNFGYSVDVSDKYVTIGAYQWEGALTNQGAAYTSVLPEIVFGVTPGAITRGNFGSTGTCAIATPTVTGATGGVTYSWSTGQTSAGLTGINPGTYILTTTDSASNYAITTYVVANFPQVTVTPGLITHASGITTADGAIAASTATGGTGTYTYAWIGAATTITTPTTLAAKTSLLPGQYTLTITDSQGATASYVYDLTYTLTTPISSLSVASDPVDNDYFGASSAADGQYMVCGAYNKMDVTGLATAGAAYIFRRTDTSATGTYTFETKLVSATPGASFRFGQSVAISGDTVVVGEYGGGTSASGKVYVWFRTTGTTWTQQGPLVASDPSSGDVFGVSVAIDGNYIAVGAQGWCQKTPSSITGCGAAYVFLRSGTTWAQQARLLASDPTANDNFGNAVAISASTIVVGAFNWDRKTPSALTDCGAAYVFVRSGTTWSQQAQLLANDPSASDYFGSSVSVNGDYVAVGAYAWDSKAPAVTDCGCVYIYYRSGTTWTQQAQLTTGDQAASDRFGASVSINSSYVVAGASNKGDGRAYMYRRTGTSWSLVKKLAPADSGNGGGFGQAVDMDEKYVVVGFPFRVYSKSQGGAYSTVLPEVTFSVAPGVITQGNNGSVNTCAIGAPTVTGGSGTYTYSWSTGQTSAGITGISPGTFVLTTTDASTGNYAVTTYAVANYAPVSATSYVITHSSTSTSANGSITSVVGAGGTGTYTAYAWTWSNGASTISTPTTSGSKTSLLPGQYTVTVTDSNGVTGSTVFAVGFTSALSTIVNASDPITSDYFGYSSAVDGQYMIVGAYNKMQTQSSAGAAYIYKRTDTTTTGTYVFEKKLISQTTGTSFQFGSAVAISGDTVVVGEHGGGTSASGKAYVWFRTSGTTWTQQGPIVPSDPTGGDHFGDSVAIDGDYIAVSTPYWAQKTPYAISNCGAAYVFLRSGTTWAQQARLLASDPGASDYFGVSIAISGSTVVGGAMYWSKKTFPTVSGCGAAYVFFRSGTSWSQQAQLVAYDPQDSTRYGQSVSIDGDTIAVGAPIWNQVSPLIQQCGSVYVYVRSGTTWTLQAQLDAGDRVTSAFFGSTVSINSNCLVAGASNKTSAAGAAYVFKRAGSSWYMTKMLTASDAAASDYLGCSVDVSDKYVTVGAYAWEGTYTDQGAVYTSTVTGAFPVTVTPGLVTHASGIMNADGAIAASAVTGGSELYASYVWTWSAGATPITTPTTPAAKSALLPGQYTLTITDSNGVTGSYVYEVRFTTALSALVNASDPAATDYFGRSSAVDGQYMIVGAYNKTQTLASAGAAYIFKRTDTTATGTYAFETKLVSQAIGSNFYFGYSVAISGDTVVVGEFGGGPPSQSGKAYVWFRTTGTTWTQQGPIVPSDPTAGNNFGLSVSIDGDYIAVGAYLWSQTTPSAIANCGAAYVFLRSGTTWTQQAILLASDPTAGDQFGNSIAISASTVVVGVSKWDQKTPSALTDSGAAYVFVRTGTTWAQQAQLLAADPSATDYFGYSVSVSGDYVAVCAYAWDCKAPAVADCGCVYVFFRSGTTWTQQAQLTAGDRAGGDLLGASVSINGSYLVTGAFNRNSGAGGVYVYRRSGTSWSLSRLITASDAAASDRFGGSSVDLSDRYVAVGAPYWEGALTDQGAVYTTIVDPLFVSTTGVQNCNFGTANTGNITPTVLGGVGAVTYAWTGSSATTQNLTGLAPGSYTLTATDSLGYTATASFTVATNAAMVLTPGLVTHASGITNADGAIALSAVTGGTGTYTYAWTSTGASTITTPTTLAAKTSLLPGRYVLTATDSNGIVAAYAYDVAYSVYLNPAAPKIVYASDPATNDLFGVTTAADGQYMIVGAQNKTQTQTQAGAAYIFRRTDTSPAGTYVFEAKLVSATTGTGFNLGRSVAISGDTAVVGEPGGGTSGSGKVYVWFRTSGTTWTQQGPIVPSDPSSSDRFGKSVAVDGDYIAVGADSWSQKSPSIGVCGAAYVFLRTGTTWAQQARLQASDPSASDQFGWSIAMSGATIVVGTFLWDQKTPSAITDCGAAYVFVRSGTTWSQQAQILPNDPSAGDAFGDTVSISGDYIAVGATQWDSKSPSIANCGCVYVFVRNGTTWTLQAQLVAGDMAASDQLGTAVSINANTSYLVAGAYGRTSNAGCAFLYRRTGTIWNMVTRFTGAGVASDAMGCSADVTDRYVVIGAYGYDGAGSNAGGTYTTVLPEITLTVVAGAITRGNFGSTGTCAIAAPTVTGANGAVTYSWSTGQTTSTLSGISPGTFVLTTTDSVGTYTTTTYVVANYLPVTVTPGLITHASGITNADGSIALSAITGGTGTYVIAWTSGIGATTITTPTTLAAKSSLLPGQYTLTVTDSNGIVAVYVYDVSYMSLISTIVNASDPATTDYFGSSSAVDGQYMVVGAYNKTQTQTGAGAAYIYKRSDTSATGTYALEAKLVSGTTGSNFQFGYSVAMSGDTVVVGEPGGGTTQSGKAYVWFRTTGTTWTQQGPIVPSDPRASDHFGYSVAIDGDYIAVGAQNWDQKTPSAITDCGAAYVFLRTNTTWAQQAQLLASDPTASDWFGNSIAISGATVVVGAYQWDSKTPAITDCGCVYIYVRTGTTWAQQAQILPNDPTASDNFGYSVSVSGDYVAVGAYQWDSKTPAVTNCGCVYIYYRSGTTWTQQAQLAGGDPAGSSYMGVSVSINSSYLVTGARGRASFSGCAYLYKRTGTSWFLAKQLTASDAATLDLFGYSVDVSDKYIAIGAYQWEGTFTDQGAAYTTVLPEIVFTVVPGAITRGNFGSTGTCAIATPTVTGATGGVTYSWSTGQTTASLSNINPGTYVLTTTDSAGNYAVTTYVVANFPQLTVTPGLVTHASGPTNATGAIALSAVTGGTGTYTTYAWTSGIGASTITTPTTLAAKSALLPGQYTLTVTDSNSGVGSYMYDVSYVSPIASTYIVNASDPAAGDYFGASSAVDGQYMIVGAPNKTQTQTIAGAAYIFRRSDTSATGTYAFETKLVSQTTGTSFYFGATVAISGDTVVVGEYGGGTTRSGKVYVWFRTSGTTWTQQGPLVPSDPSANDNFGYSVAVDGDYIAVGAPFWDRKTPSAITDCGAAYVFVRTGTTWAQQAQLLANDPTASDQFGYSIAISASTVVVGARTWDQKTPAAITDCGAAYVFVRTGTTWTQQAQLLASDPSASDRFGSYVAVYGDYVAVGVLDWDMKVPAINGCGCVYVYYRSGTTWTQQAQLTAGDQATSDSLGLSISMNANYLVAGAYGRNTSTGCAYLYKRTGTSWLLTKQLTASDAAATDYFGISVDVSDKYIAIGAQLWEGTLTDQGAIYTTVLPANAAITATGGAITPTNFGLVTGSIGAITVMGGTDTYVSYAWTSSSGATTGLAANTAAHTALKAGTYTMVATDTLGATGTFVFVVTENTAVAIGGGSITNVLVNGAATGAIVAVTATGGSGTYVSYAWTSSSGASTGLASNAAAHSGLKAGTYTLLVTDSLGATATRTFVITQNAVISATGGAITSVLVNGRATGAIGAVAVAGGSGTYVSYVWSSSAGASTGLAANAAAHTALKAGTYTLLVTDSVGGVGTFVYTVTQNTAVTVGGGAITHASRYGQALGAIAAVSVSGGSGSYVSYAWSSSAGATTGLAANSDAHTSLKAGTYTLVVTDSVGGSATTVFAVGEAIAITFTTTACSQYDSTDGAVSTSVVGGVPGASYTYLWSTGSTAASLSGLAAGDYTLTVTSGAVTETATATVTEPLYTGSVAGVTPISASLTWPTSRDAPTSSSIYTVSYAGPDGIERSDGKLLTTPAATVVGLTPSTAYTFHVYRIKKRLTGAKKMFSTVSATTPANIPANYNIAYLAAADGSVDLTGTSLSAVAAAATSVFNTGDIVKVTTRLAASTTTTFVKDQASFTTDAFKAILLPFAPSEGAGQAITISETMTGGISETVTYDNTANTITLAGQVYSAGSKFFIAGKYRVHVCET